MCDTPNAPTAENAMQFSIDALVNEFYYATVAFAEACEEYTPFCPEMNAATSRVNQARSAIEAAMLRDRAALLAARREVEAVQEENGELLKENMQLDASKERLWSAIKARFGRDGLNAIRDDLARAALAATQEET